MRYLATLAIVALVCAPVSAQRTHGKRTHDKAKVERVVQCEKECKCVCHKSKKADHAKRGKQGDRKHGDRKRIDRKRGDRRRGQDRKRGKATPSKKTREYPNWRKLENPEVRNRLRKLMESKKRTKHGLIAK